MHSVLRAAAARPRRLAADARLPEVRGYSLVRRLAEGRWSELFLARAESQKQDAAADYVVKCARVLAHDLLPCSLLQREAAVAAAVSHPNLISVLDADWNGPQPFIVLPLLSGQTLEQLPPQSLTVSVPQTLWYFRQIAAALQALHAAGWLHGDVSARNVIVSPQGQATLIDLGLARRLDNAECRVDQWLTGDRDDLPPEAFQPRAHLTAAADIYRLGVLLFRLLQGNHLLEASPLIDPRRSLSDLRVCRPDVSREVAALLSKMLAHEPLRRPAADELVATLTRLEIESLMQW